MLEYEKNKKIHPRLIGFDIDGVVADTMEAFIRIAWQDYRIEVKPEDITAFQVEDCLDMDPSLVNDIFDRLLEDPVASDLKPMLYADRVLKEFAQVAPLTFVTARPQKKPIAQWLKSMLGEEIYKDVRLVATGEHDDKADHIKEMGLQYFVDDRAQTCTILENEGIIPIVYSQPWNYGKHDLQFVDNWLAIRELCFEA